MATTVKIVTLSGKKYQLIPLAGAKAPAGVETINWEGQNYILSPIVTASPAPKVEEKKEEPKATVKTEEKTSGTPWWVWVLGAILILAILVMVFGKNPVTSPASAPVSNSAPAATAVAEPFAANHNSWSAYGVPSFVVTDGNKTESASDVFTDPTKGDLTLTVKPTEETCLLQYGITKIFTDEFSAKFAANDTGAGFRVISKSYWDTLPVSDGAYNLCWTR